MKKVFVLFLLFVVAYGCFADGLNEYALVLKEALPDAYGSILNRASRDWGTDMSMVLYEVNRQSEAFFMVHQNEEMGPVFPYVLKWCETPNAMIEDIEHYSSYFIDWVMVEYEYNRNMEASRALF